ncbi:PHP domain-containing protein [Candidatus Falkowbacteria bacterium]|nr:PHP domain-containing protein [Candidatus Falkowbacteria bacterium]
MLKIDLHIHTVFSGHAHSTIAEYVNRAKELSMDIIGISDHGPTMYGATTNDYYFGGLKRVPQKIDGLLVLKGIEANVIGLDGELDLADRLLARLDYVMAGFHGEAYKDVGIEANTRAMVAAIRSGKVDVITHPFVTKEIAVDIKKVAEAACEHKVLLEINTSYLRSHRLTEDTLDNIEKMLAIVKRHGQKIIVNSDAHSIWELGDDAPLEKLRHKIKLDDEMIINNYPKELLRLLKYDNE